MNLNNDESCIGTEVCRTSIGKPLHKYGESKTEEEICKGCKFYRTNTAFVPEEIALAVANSFEIAELQNARAKFNYPDALSPVDWMCLRGFTRGRDRADKLKRQRDDKKRRIEEKRKELNG